MIFRPAGRFLIGPLPPLDAAALVLAAVIRPPRDFLAISVFSVFLLGCSFVDTDKIRFPSLHGCRSGLGSSLSPQAQDCREPLAGGVPCAFLTALAGTIDGLAKAGGSHRGRAIVD